MNGFMEDEAILIVEMSVYLSLSFCKVFRMKYSL